jgi:hypothetical protein
MEIRGLWFAILRVDVVPCMYECPTVYEASGETRGPAVEVKKMTLEVEETTSERRC